MPLVCLQYSRSNMPFDPKMSLQVYVTHVVDLTEVGKLTFVFKFSSLAKTQEKNATEASYQ